MRLHSNNRRFYQFAAGALALVALLMATGGTCHADFRLMVLDRNVDVRVPPVTQHRTIVYLWVADVVEPLGFSVVSREGNPFEVDVLRGEEKILTLSEQDPVAQSSAGPVRLDYAPYVAADGRFMVPARELWEALGAYTWLAPEQNTLYVCSQLKGISVSLENERFVLHLSCSLPVNYRVYSLSGPPRLVVDLPGTKVKFTPSSFAVASQGVARIRAAQTSKQPFVARVVADLIGMQEHQLLSPPATEEIAVRIGGRFERWPFPPLPRVNSVSFSQDSPQEAEVHIRGDSPAGQFSTFILKDPLRLVVDIPEAILQGDAQQIQTDNPAVPQIRFSQYRVAPFVVRVVVVLDEPRPFFLELKDGIIIRFSLRPGKGIVAVDPGHGGDDSGAVGKRGTQEKAMNLDIALRLAHLLIQEGVKPILTRSTNTFVPLDDRCDFANAIRADVFVSLHCNASPSGSGAKGLETYYFHPRSEDLARIVHQQILARLSYRDKGVRVARFVVVRKTAMPAILVEMGYISNYEEEALLRTPDYRQRMAEALRDGILEYFRAHDLGPWSKEN